MKAAAATPISSLLPHTSLEDLLISAILLAVPLVFVGKGLVGSSAQTKVEFLNSLPAIVVMEKFGLFIGFTSAQ